MADISKIKLAKSMGFNNINVDLIYAIPGEKMLTLKSDVKSLLKLGIEHISTYSLIVEEHTKIYNDGVTPIDEELDYKMYKYICKTLKKNNFVHYEVSNFALKGYESIVTGLYNEKCFDIRSNKFEISPAYISDNDNACRFCPYKDVCHRKPSQYRKLNKERGIKQRIRKIQRKFCGFCQDNCEEGERTQIKQCFSCNCSKGWGK